MYIESNEKYIKIFVVAAAVGKDMVLEVQKWILNKKIEGDMIYVWVRKTNHWWSSEEQQ
jgi:hypothetical protein